MPKATINDVAELAGVSIKTVSRVVNGEPNVRDSTRKKVESAVARLKYRPNPSARNLASQRSRVIGLVYDDPAAYEIPSSGYVISLQQGVLNACKPTNYDLLIHPCNYRGRSSAAGLKAFIEQARPAGIIIAPPLSNMPKLVNAIESSGTPSVRISPGNDSGKQGIVSTNDREACAEMTQYLASLGHRRIAFLTGHPSHKAVANRFLGYQDGLKKSGLKFSKNLVVSGDNSIRSGEACASTLLNRSNAPTAIFAANDDMAAGVIRVADRLGIDVPGQLSVVGFDDIALAQQVYPALTTIRQPLEAMAEEAARILIESRGAPLLTPPKVVPSALQIRASTGPGPHRTR